MTLRASHTSTSSTASRSCTVSSGGRSAAASASARSASTPTRPRSPGDWVVEEHTEEQLGHEELYVVVRGPRALHARRRGDRRARRHARLHLRPGSVKRVAVAEEEGTTVLAVGGKPGEAFTPSAVGVVLPGVRAADGGRDRDDAERDRGARRARPAATTTSPASRRGRAGSTTRARHLARAIELDPRLSEIAATGRRPEGGSVSGYTVTRLDEIAKRDTWIPVRDALRHRRVRRQRLSQAEEAGAQVISDHTELMAKHEELYVVVEGHATFTVDGEEVDAPAGTLVFVADPASRRSAVAKEAGTTVLVVGGRPGEAFEVSPWEESWRENGEAMALYREKRYADAAAVLREAVERFPDSAGLEYNLACFESMAGADARRWPASRPRDRALPGLRDFAREDSDFDPSGRPGDPGAAREGTGMTYQTARARRDRGDERRPLSLAAGPPPPRHHRPSASTAWTARERRRPDHQRARRGRDDGDEELYVVLDGHATFEIDGDGVDAPAGTLVFVPRRDVQAHRVRRGGRHDDPGHRRAAGQGVRGVGLGALGAGQPATTRAATTRGRSRSGPERRRSTPSIRRLLYNLACLESLAGRNGRRDRAPARRARRARRVRESASATPTSTRSATTRASSSSSPARTTTGRRMSPSARLQLGGLTGSSADRCRSRRSAVPSGRGRREADARLPCPLTRSDPVQELTWAESPALPPEPSCAVLGAPYLFV